MEKLLLLFVMLASIDYCWCFRYKRSSYYYYYDYNQNYPSGWEMTTPEKTSMCCTNTCYRSPYTRCYSLTLYEKGQKCRRFYDGICRCDPNVSDCITTTTTSTTTTTTTPAPAKPKTSTSRKRGIGSLRRRRAVSQADKDLCPASGVIRFTGDKNHQLCNGLLGYNPTTRSSQIYVTDVCRKRMLLVDSLHYLLNDGTYISVEIQNPADIEFTALANNMSSFAPPIELEGAKCKKKSSLYDPAIKGDEIDLSKCHVTTFDIEDNGVALDKMWVHSEISCENAPVTEAAQCFIANSKHARGCLGDSGSPVHCRLKNRGKTVVYGLLDDINVLPGDATDDDDDNLCADNNEFYVLPLS